MTRRPFRLLNCLSMTISFSALLLALWLSGCSRDTGAAIRSIQQSDRGNVVAFSESGREGAWVVSSDNPAPLGWAPFSVSPSGRSAVSVKPFSRSDSSIELQAYDISPGQARVSKTLRVSLADNHADVDAIRSNDAIAVLKVFVGAGSYKYIAVDWASGQYAPTTESAWLELPEGKPLERTDRSSDSTRIIDHGVADGAIVREIRKAGQPREIWLVRGGSEKLLLRQSAGSRVMESVGKSVP